MFLNLRFKLELKHATLHLRDLLDSVHVLFLLTVWKADLIYKKKYIYEKKEKKCEQCFSSCTIKT